MIINTIYNNYFNEDYFNNEEIVKKNHRQILNMNTIIINQAILLRRF